MGYIISFYVEMGLKYPKPALNSLFRTKDDCELPNTLSLPPGTLSGIIGRALSLMPSVVIPNTQNMPALIPSFPILSHY